MLCEPDGVLGTEVCVDVDSTPLELDAITVDVAEVVEDV